MNLQQAERKQAKVKMGLMGPSGADDKSCFFIDLINHVKMGNGLLFFDREQHDIVNISDILDQAQIEVEKGGRLTGLTGNHPQSTSA